MAHTRTADNDARVIKQCGVGRRVRNVESKNLIVANARTNNTAPNRIMADVIAGETERFGLFVAPCACKVIRITANGTPFIDNDTGEYSTLRLRTKATTNGVYFPGTATSNIVVAANTGQNNKAACHITIKFKLDTTFTVGAASDLYLFQKALDANNWIRIYLESTDGKLYWVQGDGAGGAQFALTSTTASWTAGTWYTVTCSLDDAPAQRLLVNGTAQDTDTQAAVATPNGGNIIIGSSSDGGTNGVIGTIAWTVMGFGTTAAIGLTSQEEVDLGNGFLPAVAKIQHLFRLNEGEGTAARDAGTLGISGTLDSGCRWAYVSMDSDMCAGITVGSATVPTLDTAIDATLFVDNVDLVEGQHVHGVLQVGATVQTAVAYIAVEMEWMPTDTP